MPFRLRGAAKDEVNAPTSVDPVDTLTIICSTTDTLSGVADADCETIEVDATSLAPGPNTFAFTATDLAGNTATSTTTVTLDVDVNSIVDLIAHYLGDTPGASGQLNALTQQLDNGDTNGFNNHVWAQCCSACLRSVRVRWLIWAHGALPEVLFRNARQRRAIARSSCSVDPHRSAQATGRPALIHGILTNSA